VAGLCFVSFDVRESRPCRVGPIPDETETT